MKIQLKEYYSIIFLIFIIIIIIILFYILESIIILPYIFFYGTLRKNEKNYYRIKNNKLITYIGEGITHNNFTFFINKKTKYFPAITENTKYNKKIQIVGDLYKINNNGSLFSKIYFLYNLDKIENRYNRKIVKVICNNQIKYAYIYILKDDFLPKLRNKFFIKNGDYTKTIKKTSKYIK